MKAIIKVAAIGMLLVASPVLGMLLVLALVEVFG